MHTLTCTGVQTCTNLCEFSQDLISRTKRGNGHIKIMADTGKLKAQFILQVNLGFIVQLSEHIHMPCCHQRQAAEAHHLSVYSK